MNRRATVATTLLIVVASTIAACSSDDGNSTGPSVTFATVPAETDTPQTDPPTLQNGQQALQKTERRKVVDIPFDIRPTLLLFYGALLYRIEWP